MGIISVPISFTVTVKVYHCSNGHGPFDGQIGFRTNSICQCKFDSDCDSDCDRDGDRDVKGHVKGPLHRSRIS